MAGYIDGLVGIVQSLPQNDLARSTATPDITRKQLQTWAEQQKDILLAQDMLNSGRSRVLARYGATHQQLVIGCLDNQEITQQGLIEYLNSVVQFAVHDGEIEHDGDDDVKAREFDDFSANSDVLTLEVGGFFESAASWTPEIPHPSTDTSSWSLKKAFEEALESSWGDEEHWSMERATYPVGEVNGTTIYRYCDVYSRP